MWSRPGTWRMGAGTAVPVALPLQGAAAAWPRAAGLPVLNVRGVGAGAAGVELGASLVDREQVNTGTACGSPAAVLPGQRGEGTLPAVGPGRGGALVVVRGRESRPHGEGGQ